VVVVVVVVFEAIFEMKGFEVWGRIFEERLPEPPT